MDFRTELTLLGPCFGCAFAFEIAGGRKGINLILLGFAEDEILQNDS